MSKKPTDSVELHRLGSRYQENMSVSDPTGTDTGVSGVCPLYNTVEGAQTDVEEYKNRAAPSKSLVQEDYTVPGPLDPPNEYDIVTDKQRENRSPGYLHQNNILYADQFAAQEMKHATLTRSDQHKFAGQTSVETVKETGESCSGCGSVCLWLSVISVFVVVALLAIAAVVMVVLVIVQVIPVCNCADSSGEVQELRRMVEQLSAALENTSANVSSLDLQLNTLNITPVVEAAIAERITGDGTIIGLNFSAELRDFEPFSDCQTSIERTCEITTSVFRCETTDLPYILTDSGLNYTQDARCIRMPGTTDQNIMSAVLVIDEETNDLFCLCYRQTVGNNIVDDITCGLQVTRCRSSRTIPVNVVTTSSATRIPSGN